MPIHEEKNLFSFLQEQIKQDLPIPLYIQLQEAIEAAVECQILKPSHFLPPERRLAEELKISRVTVSKALNLLEKKKFIKRQQGSGTSILPQIHYPLLNKQGFTKTLFTQGEVSDQWLLKEKTQADYKIAKALNIKTGDFIAKLSRIRLLSGQPTSIETNYIPLSFLPHPEAFKGSLYQFWEDKGIKIAHTSYRLKALLSNEQNASLLNISQGTALISIHQTTMNEKDDIIEYSHSLCRGDMYEIHAQA